jgi:putative nucleotidyltransferase with HDIG domain
VTGSTDVSLILQVILDQALPQLGAAAAAILLYDPVTQGLNYASGAGFRTEALRHTQLAMGQGYAGRAAMARQMVHVPDLRSRNTDFLRSPSFSQEGFISYTALPLIAKGEIKGVLEVFHRTPLEPDSEWQSFLETLAGQAATAVDSATMFEDLQRANDQLTLAYDATIEGWSRAMDLRDRETEGHSQRVAETTVQLARLLGLPDQNLVHVRRGALLHDIGKMGVPDEILQKVGPLTDAEWVVMRRHPVMAYEMLAHIRYLEPALEIPYCHHEKWDGSGYPRGLQGDRIPLAARVFAVVDVYDALTANRPYRPADVGKPWSIFARSQGSTSSLP